MKKQLYYESRKSMLTLWFTFQKKNIDTEFEIVIRLCDLRNENKELDF